MAFGYLVKEVVLPHIARHRLYDLTLNSFGFAFLRPGPSRHQGAHQCVPNVVNESTPVVFTPTPDELLKTRSCALQQR